MTGGRHSSNGSWFRPMRRVLLTMAALLVARPEAVAFDNAAGVSSGQPLWEVNLFGGAVRLPHYRGSDEYVLYALPLPYLVYRGDILKIDREGLRSIFLENHHFETGFSMDGQPPSYRDTRAREGMASLGAVLEFGPMLQFFPAGRDRPNPFCLAVAVRSAVSMDPDDLRIAGQGGRAQIEAVYRNRTRWQARDGSFGMRVSLNFADRRYNGYFYDVALHEATATRPAYRSGEGYAGMSLSLTGQVAMGSRWSLGGYYRWDNLSGAVFTDSPLVKTENNHTVGCALIWNLFQSRETVPRSP